MNGTLEAMARALFKSWFVDFDPVRAKVEFRDSCLPKPPSSCFPDSFDESESGEIPNRWRRARISEWATALSGGTPSKSDPKLWDGVIPWISPKVMNDIHADDADEYVSQRAIDSGARLAPSGSTLVMVRGMGLHQQVRVSQARRQVSFNQDVKALVPTRIEASLLLFALLDAQQELLGRVESSGHGTGKLPSDVLLDHPITLPGLSVQRELASVFDSLNSRIASARDQSRTLSALRDVLLPKLISGDLRVRDADRIVAAAI
jgi:type I restriction enzyme, S subunit